MCTSILVVEKHPHTIEHSLCLLALVLCNHVKAECRMLFSQFYLPCIQSFSALWSVALT